MTADETRTPWGQVASTLRGDGPATPPDPGAAGSVPSVPTGWEGVASAVGKTPPAPSAPSAGPRSKGTAAPQTSAPSGWGGVATALSDGQDDSETGGEGDGYDEEDDAFVATPATEGRGPLVKGRPGGRLLERLRRPRVAMVAAAAVVVVVVGVVLAIVLPGGGLPANAAISYNGKVTTVDQFNAQVQVLNKLNGVAAPPVTDPGYPQFLRTTAKGLAVTQMVGSLAKKQGISVSQKTTRDSLDQEVQSAYGGDQSKFNQALSAAGITEDQVLAALNAQAVENQLFAKVTKKATVSATQVAAAFTANQSALSVPEQRTIAHIVVASQDAANSIITQLQGGASFATLAQQNSLDTSTKAQGGALGTVAASQLSSPFGPAAFAAQANVPFGPVQEQGGAWDVGLVTTVTPAVTYTNDAQTQTGISNYLTDQQLLNQWDGYLSAELKKAHISYAAKYRPTQPYTPPAASLPAIVAFVANAHSSTGASPSGPAPSGLPGTTGSTGNPTTP